MNTPYIIVDTSYLVYYHGFATWSWYGYEFGKEGIPTNGSFDPMSDPEYAAAYEKRFFTRIYKAIKKFVPLMDKSRIIFALDCHRRNIWRNEVFPEYKINRKKIDKTREFSWNTIFTYTKDILLPKYRDQFNSSIIQQRHAEGDDIIAILTKELHDQGHDVVVVASDGDLVQLCNYCRIVTLKGEEKTPISVNSKFKNIKGIDWNVDNYLMHKVIMGDGGDEIPAISPGIGPKRASAFINNSELLLELIERNPEVGKNLKRNDTLINFKNIPEEVKLEILNCWKSETQNGDFATL